MTPTCISPPELTDEQLIRHLGGEEAAETVKHLERCSYCNSRLEALSEGLGSLTRKVYRSGCPSSMELTGYHMGELSGEDSRRIRDHLALCAACRGEIARFRQFLEATEIEPAAEAGLVERAGIVIAELLAGGGGRQVAVGLRGDGDDVRIYEAGELQVTLVILADTGAAFQISGLLMGAAPEGWTAVLWRGDERSSAVEVDSGGGFHILAIPAGEYTLILDGPQDEVHIQDLRI